MLMSYKKFYRSVSRCHRLSQEIRRCNVVAAAGVPYEELYQSLNCLLHRLQ